MRIIGTSYEAGYHCLDCFKAEFNLEGVKEIELPRIMENLEDSEGNPVHALHDIDEYLESVFCENCLEEIFEISPPDFEENDILKIQSYLANREIERLNKIIHERKIDTALNGIEKLLSGEKPTVLPPVENFVISPKGKFLSLIKGRVFWEDDLKYATPFTFEYALNLVRELGENYSIASPDPEKNKGGKI